MLDRLNGYFEDNTGVVDQNNNDCNVENNNHDTDNNSVKVSENVDLNQHGSSEIGGYEELHEIENELSESINFENTCEGDWVAVYYDQDLFVGRVLTVNDKFTADVSFIERSRLRKDSHVFCWPQSADIDTVDSKFILKQGFAVEDVPCGRSWVMQIPEYKDLETLHKEYKMKYCS